MEKKKINFTRLVESLRWYEKEYKGSIMVGEDKKTFSLAADVLEDLLQSVAEWTAKYEAERDKNMDAVPVVRCKECIHRPKMPDNHVDGFDLEFPDHKCPCRCEDGFYSWYPADDWFCADGERRTE